MATEKKKHKNKSERGFTQENGPSVKSKESRRSIKKDPFVYTDSGNFSDEDNLTIEEQFYGLADEEIEYHEVTSKKRKKLKPVEIECTLELAKENVQEKDENDQQRKEQKHHKHKNGIDLVTVENLDEQTVVESVSTWHKKRKNIEKNDKVEDHNQKVKKTKHNGYGKLEERLQCSAVPEENETEQEEIQARNKAVKKKKADEADNENQKVKKRKKQNDPEEFRKIHHQSIPEEEKKQREEIHNKKKKTKTGDVVEMEAEIPKVKKKKKTRNDTEELEEMCRVSSNSVSEEEKEEAQARNHERKKKKKKVDETECNNQIVKKKKRIDAEELEETEVETLQYSVAEEEEEAQAKNSKRKKKNNKVDEWEDENQKVKERKKRNDPKGSEEIRPNLVPEEQEDEEEIRPNLFPEEQEDEQVQEEVQARNNRRKKKKKRIDAEELEETEVETLQYSVAEEKEEEEGQTKNSRRKKKNNKVDEWEDENQKVKEKKKRNDPRGSEEIRPNLVPEEQEDEQAQKEVQVRNNRGKKKRKRNDAEELEETEVETLQYSVAEEEEVQAKNGKRKKKNNKVDELEDENQKVKGNKERNDLEGSEGILPNLVPEEQDDEQEQEEVQTRNNGRKKKKKKVDEAECKNQLVKMKKRNDAEELEETEVEETLQYLVGEEEEEAQVKNSRRKKKNNKKEQEEVQAENNRMEKKRVDKTDDENQKIKKRKKQNSPEKIQQDSNEKTGGCEVTINIESSDEVLSTSGEEDSEEYKRLLSSLIHKQRNLLNCISEEINDVDREVEAGPSIIDEINRNIRKHAKVSRKFVEDYELEKVAKNRRKLRTTVDPSEELPKKLAENALSRDQARILSKLKIFVPWQPAPLHLIETAIIRSPTVEQLEEISKQKLEVKKNAFSAKEDEILMNNWRNFCRLHDVDADPAMFLKLKHLDVKNLRPKQRLNFARSLARNLDNRLLVSVYNRFKRICSKEKLNTGRFTKAEDEMILNYLQSSGPMNISKLALILNRDFRAVRDRANALTKPRNPLVFTDCELKNFVRELMKATETHDVQELKNKDINSECWHEVSSNLNVPVKNLRKTWQLVAYPRLFMHESFDSRALKENLIKRIQDSAVKNYDDIDWEQLASGIDGFTPQLLHKMFKEIVEYYVPQPFKESLTKALIYLQNAVVAKHKFRTGRRFKPLHV